MLNRLNYKPLCGCDMYLVDQTLKGQTVRGSIISGSKVWCPNHQWVDYEPEPDFKKDRYVSRYFSVEAIQYKSGVEHTCFRLEQFLGWDEGMGRDCSVDGSDCKGGNWYIEEEFGILNLEVNDWLCKIGNTYFALHDDVFRALFETQADADRQFLAEDAIKRAWIATGPQPEIHDKAKKKLRKNWPFLHDALRNAYGR